MKTTNNLILTLIIALIFIFSFIGINGLNVGKLKIPNLKDSMKLGLELAGGINIILEADTDLRGEKLNQLMDQTMLVISKRVDSLGILEPNISIEGDKRIRLELAGISEIEKGIEILGKTAQLEFLNEDKKLLLTGKDVIDSQVKFQGLNIGKDDIAVSIEFSKKGRKKFEEISRDLILEKDLEKRKIYIVLDGQIISSPSLDYIDDGGRVITDGKILITGDFDLETATNLSNLIKAGALPVEMKEISSSIIGPTLGNQSFEKSIISGIIGMIIIFIFLISLYKGLGLAAALSLAIYVIGLLNLLSGLGVVLTISGIAGIILSIGMAVDANILIFERIKEEIKEDKITKTYIDIGFKKAYNSIIDSNITTLIVGFILYYFGIGPIKGFGITLIIGILLSLLTSVFITKFLINLLASILGYSKLYGV